jgi:hypothetical protein
MHGGIGPLVALLYQFAKEAGNSVTPFRPACIASRDILPNGSQTFEEQWQEEVIHGPSPASREDSQEFLTAS